MPDSAVSFGLGNAELVADLTGALWWPAERTLAFADLHFEKGSSFAVRGKLVPPYDTRATLAKMLGAILRYRPERVICLGDSFHDLEAAARMGAADTRQLKATIKAVHWTWIAGNHDPEPPQELGGEVVEDIQLGGLTFRHEAVAMAGEAQGDLLQEGGWGIAGPDGAEVSGEVSGHFHPKATVRAQGRRITRPCFITGGGRLILPAFGAFTGGLRVSDPAIQVLFPDGFTVHMLGREGLFTFPSHSRAFGS